MGSIKGDGWPSFAFETVAPGDDFEFAADGFLDWDDGPHLEDESGERRTEFVNGHEIVTFHQHMAAPLANSNDEKVDLETGGRFPLAEYLKDSFLGILLLHGRTLRAFEPANHVFHWHPSRLMCLPGGAT